MEARVQGSAAMWRAAALVTVGLAIGVLVGAAPATPSALVDAPAAQLPASTPENGRIVFTRYTGGQMSLYTIEPSGADERAVLPIPGNQEFPAWSPDGTRLAFWRTSLQCLFQCGGPGEIVVVDPDGASPRVVVDDALEPGMAWSPDGSELVYVAAGPGGSDLYVKPLDGGSARLLVSLPGGEGVPSWSPDGSRIAFADQTQNDVRQVWVVNADGSGLRQLTHTHAINSDPDWSPDGEWLAYVSGEPTADLYVMRPDGTDARQLTHDGASADPAWSPDGKQLTYIRYEDFSHDVWVLDADGENERPVTNGFEYEGFPDWQAVTPSADVAVRQRPRQRTVRLGEEVAIDVTVENRGTVTATRVRASIAVWPPDAEVAFDAGPLCSGRLPVNCALGSIPPGESVQLVLHVRAPRPGSVVSMVRALTASADRDTSNDRSAARVRVVADLSGQ